MKWENKQVVDAYRVDEVERGFEPLPEVDTHPIGFIVLAVFIVLCLLAVTA